MIPAAVRHLHIRMDYEQLYELDLTNFLLLQLVCRGVKRCQGDSSRVRLPITIIHPQLFHALLAISSTTYSDSIMIWATMTLAFFGFLRLGELTCNSKFSPEIHITSDDVKFFPHMSNPDFTTAYIKTSKTDPFRNISLPHPGYENISYDKSPLHWVIFYTLLSGGLDQNSFHI